ncbi:Mn2+/Fe2+ NRAMP family transporter [Nocardioides massiliensis]|uniref:Mn2+/Fe2+ NRAMP family transporter n=1 Tax=Nocardioides massiliensis TaxID=1325935 RepID=A0ABT9NTQ8_9ACTN|nr:divalent metal cation transporter [Nocardioides massiliensis]MDP9823811.1 Mn2+/Fe2+ NRAMP family transporter [Nocardioides massiliensis]
MATSAIGPGFITQTATFTIELGAAFACAIVLSILVDIAVQMNVWRVVGVAGRRAHELANEVVRGAGWILAALVLVGGLVFNVGNVAGSGLGLDALLGLDPRIGGAISAALACGIFVSKQAGVALDRLVVVLGLVMVVATAIIAVTSSPPVGEALRNVVMPEEFSVLAVTTIIGGTVGGYITYAGAHRLLDSGRTGVESAREIGRSSVVGILVTGVMRVVLFLAILGVVAGGASIDETNPAASAFGAAMGEVGMRVFGLILWAAALTSVIGASYTSVSFHHLPHAGTATQPPDRRLHRRDDRGLPARAGAAGDVAGLRRCVQRDHPSARVRRPALDRLAAPRPAARIPLSRVAAGRGRGSVGLDAVSRLQRDHPARRPVTKDL